MKAAWLMVWHAIIATPAGLNALFHSRRVFAPPNMTMGTIRKIAANSDRQAMAVQASVVSKRA